jgi:flagellar biosynthesis protein FliR
VTAIGIGPDSILTAFVIFCRIGGCLMIMPGFSSARIPMQVRLFVVLGVTLALSPLVAPIVTPGVTGAGLGQIVFLIVTESLIGAQLGLIGRIFFLALQTLAHAMAMFMGFGMMAGVPLDEAEPIPAMASLVTMTATALIFITNQHWEILRGLAGSYSLIPPITGLSAQFALIRLVDKLGEAFVLALQISAPFMMFALVVNFAMGVMNKLVQQIPVYFISLPFVIAGGLLMFYFLSAEMLMLFNMRFSSFLQDG